jgi:hypothetical protein
MSPLSLLRAALTIQVLLGLARFLAPYAGEVIDIAVEQQRASRPQPAVLPGSA